MEQDIKTTLRKACQALLRPVASVVLRSGMTWREFAEISKAVFVSVATDDFGIRNRPTNVSRVSILTGISRKEVKRQRELLVKDNLPESSKTTDATRLLSGWHQDSTFLGRDGNPMPLHIDGPAPNFSTLFSAYGGDTPEQTLVKELISAGSIAEDREGRLFPQRRYHMPGNLDAGNIRFFGTNLHDHAQTLSDNISGDDGPKRLEGFAIDDQIHPDAVEAFREFVDQRGQQLLEEVDEWLSEHRVDTQTNNLSPVRLGLGVYAIQGQLPKGTLS